MNYRSGYRTRRIFLAAIFVFGSVSLGGVSSDAQETASIEHRIRLDQAQDQVVEIESKFPSGGQETLQFMMPVWSPGYYVVQNYAEKISGISAVTSSGQSVEIEQLRPNRWMVKPGGADAIVVTYRLKCDRCSVTTNWIGETYAVFNGGATYLNLVGDQARSHRVRVDAPAQWQVFTGLTTVDGEENVFEAKSYETLVDSPLLAGRDLGVHEFEVDGTSHVLVDAGAPSGWDGAAAAETIKRVVEGTRDFWGELPFQRYVFLNTLNNGGGGLEHLNSTLISTRFGPNNRNREPWASYGWLSFVCHEYFHAFNVKRLRPLELGPFDYEQPPRTPSLWISEGLTSYYGNLIPVRVDLGTPDDFLRSMSGYINQLQSSPGRREQSLADASLNVWAGGQSGVIRDRDRGISYYVKGPIVGFLLDAKIRAATEGEKSLDDVMRLAYQRYSGERGFTPDEFEAVAEEVAGVDLSGWFKIHLWSTEELDYQPALDWFGLQFNNQADARNPWSLEIRGDATEQQRSQLRSLIGDGE